MTDKKKNLAIKQEVSSNEETNQNTSNASTEAVNKLKTLEDHQKEFERLNGLFNRKNRFQRALNELSIYAKELKNEDSSNLESNEFKLVLGHGYNKEDLKISNREVISETILFLTAKIKSTIENIEFEILHS
jgi:hypothetical protein